MNKRIDTSFQGGFPLTQYSLGWMQDSYVKAISALASSFGDYIILNGVEEQNGYYSDGWVIIKGELFPFRRSPIANTIAIDEEKESRRFKDGANREIYLTKYTTSANVGGKAIVDFVRINKIAAMQAALEQTIEDILPLKDVAQKLEKFDKMLTPLMGYKDEDGNIVYGSWLFWGRPANEIPAGWEPVPDAEWKGRVPVVLDENDPDFNSIGKTNGEKKHTLLPNELPDFSMSLPGQRGGDNNDNNNQTAFAGGDKSSTETGFNFNIPVSYSRNKQSGEYDQSHNNLQPYRVVMFIRFAG